MAHTAAPLAEQIVPEKSARAHWGATGSDLWTYWVVI